MKNQNLHALGIGLSQALTATFGYCGIADGDFKMMLNSGRGSENFVITIEDRSGEEAAEEERLRDQLTKEAGGG